MKTNDLKKGARIQLRNGWYATIADNMKGNTRLADVEGFAREIGSVYSHDIITVWQDETGTGRKQWFPIIHTPAQLKLKAQLDKMGW